jgi:hypothetical protein
LSDEKVFCKWEKASFPRDQFKHYAEYGLVHEDPPEGTPKHTTSGQPLPDEEGAVKSWDTPSSTLK